MSAAGLALQKAIHAALVADAGVGALVGDRIFDVVPRAATTWEKPYCRLSNSSGGLRCVFGMCLLGGQGRR